MKGRQVATGVLLLPKWGTWGMLHQISGFANVRERAQLSLEGGVISESLLFHFLSPNPCFPAHFLCCFTGPLVGACSSLPPAGAGSIIKL